MDTNEKLEIIDLAHEFIKASILNGKDVKVSINDSELSFSFKTPNLHWFSVLIFSIGLKSKKQKCLKSLPMRLIFTTNCNP